LQLEDKDVAIIVHGDALQVAKRPAWRATHFAQPGAVGKEWIHAVTPWSARRFTLAA
jgi:hypothetical protein